MYQGYDAGHQAFARQTAVGEILQGPALHVQQMVLEVSAPRGRFERGRGVVFSAPGDQLQPADFLVIGLEAPSWRGAR